MNPKLKNRKYWVFHYELFQEYQLTSRAKEVFSFLYTHCVNYHRDGWCGYSNEAMAEIMGSSDDYIQRGLKELKEKDLIIIENPGSRSKKKETSRRIYINATHFISEEVVESGTKSEFSKLVEQLRKDNEALKKELHQLRVEQAQMMHITELGKSLIKTGFITEKQYQKQAEELNHILLDFESWHKGGRELSKACFHYWKAHQETPIKNPVNYILECIKQSKKWIIKQGISEEDYSEKLEKEMKRWYADDGK